MQPTISRKERVLFDLELCVNEIYALQDELHILDIGDLDKALKKLRCVLRDKLRKPMEPFHISI